MFVVLNQSNTNEAQAMQSPPSKRNGFFRQWKSSELLLLGGLVLLGCLILAIHLLTWGVSFWEEANRHVEGVCTVRKLYLHQRKDNRGEVFFRPEIEIDYSVGGAIRTARAYDRSTMTEDQGFVYGRAAAEEMLLCYETGRRYPCWYRADNPSFVILRKNTASFWGWWFLLIPVTLIGFGLGGLFWQARRRSVSKEKRSVDSRRASLFPTVPESQRINESPGTELAFRLPLAFFPVFQTITGLTLAIVWNLISWYLFFYIFSIRQTTADLWLAILFGLVFCGTGLVFLPWFLHRVRTAFGVGRTILEISDHPIVPGRKYRLALLQNGFLSARHYDIFVLCEEVTRYRQGTDTVTHHKEVFRLPLFTKADLLVPAGETRREEFFLKLPIGAMHSFTAEFNQINWKIAIDIEVQGKTHLKRECPLVVQPHTVPD